jgi:hypothetical protein
MGRGRHRGYDENGYRTVTAVSGAIWMPTRLGRRLGYHI